MHLRGSTCGPWSLCAPGLWHLGMSPSRSVYDNFVLLPLCHRIDLLVQLSGKVNTIEAAVTSIIGILKCVHPNPVAWLAAFSPTRACHCVATAHVQHVAVRPLQLQKCTVHHADMAAMTCHSFACHCVWIPVTVSLQQQSGS